MAFTPTVVQRGDAQRVARDPAELVQLQFDGWVVADTRAKSVITRRSKPAPPRDDAEPEK